MNTRISNYIQSLHLDSDPVAYGLINRLLSLSPAVYRAAVELLVDGAMSLVDDVGALPVITDESVSLLTSNARAGIGSTVAVRAEVSRILSSGNYPAVEGHYVAGDPFTDADPDALAFERYVSRSNDRGDTLAASAELDPLRMDVGKFWSVGELKSVYDVAVNGEGGYRQVARRLRDFFSMIDTDGDGLLSEAEIVNFFPTVDILRSYDDIQSSNYGDAGIPYEAIIDHFGGALVTEATFTRTQFFMLDSDGDGLLTRDDLRGDKLYLLHLLLPSSRDDSLQIFDDVDSLTGPPSDGIISIDELRAVSPDMASVIELTEYPAGDPRRLRDWRLLDTDGDGRITKEDVRRFRRDRLGRIDRTGGTDVLTLDELRSATDSVVSSLLAISPDLRFTAANTAAQIPVLNILTTYFLSSPNPSGVRLKYDDPPAPAAPSPLVSVKALYPKMSLREFNRLDIGRDGLLDLVDLQAYDEYERSENHPALRRYAFDILNVFAEIDSDGDGRISYEEALLAVPVMLPEDFERMDLDRDGFIEGDEIHRLTSIWVYGGYTRTQKVARSIYDSFASLDADGDGVVTMSDLEGLIPAVGLTARFSSLDSNSDRRLSPEEMEGYFPSIRALRNFDAIRRYGVDPSMESTPGPDGRLSWDEFLAAKSRITRDEYLLMDGDGDGMVTMEDLLVAFPKVFLFYAAAFKCYERPEWGAQLFTGPGGSDIDRSLINSAISTMFPEFTAYSAIPEDVIASIDPGSERIRTLFLFINAIKTPAVPLLAGLMDLLLANPSTQYTYEDALLEIGSMMDVFVGPTVFDSMDANRDGYVDLQDAVEWLRVEDRCLLLFLLAFINNSTVLDSLSQAQALIPGFTQEEFDYCDFDGDGVISVQITGDSPVQDYFGILTVDQFRPIAAFSAVDTVTSSTEVPSFATPPYDEVIPHRDVTEGADSMISWDELSATPIAVSRSQFDAMDSDRDGLISFEDVARVYPRQIFIAAAQSSDFPGTYTKAELEARIVELGMPCAPFSQEDFNRLDLLDGTADGRVDVAALFDTLSLLNLLSPLVLLGLAMTSEMALPNPASYSDLEEADGAYGIPLSAYISRSEFESYDGDGDGYVYTDEIVALLKATDRIGACTIFAAGNGGRATFAELLEFLPNLTGAEFEFLDFDGDGSFEFWGADFASALDPILTMGFSIDRIDTTTTTIWSETVHVSTDRFWNWSELRSVLDVSGPEFTRLDADGDGLVSLADIARVSPAAVLSYVVFVDEQLGAMVDARNPVSLADANGALSRVLATLAPMGFEQDLEFTQSDFDKWDTDGDGFLIDEFSFSSFGSPLVNPLIHLVSPEIYIYGDTVEWSYLVDGAPEGADLSRLREIFDAMDGDGDGVISRADASAYSDEAKVLSFFVGYDGGRGVNLHTIRASFPEFSAESYRRFDLGGDGWIDGSDVLMRLYDRYLPAVVVMMKGGMTQIGPSPRLDGDRIFFEQLNAWLAASGLPLVSAAQFDAMDVDGDGALSLNDVTLAKRNQFDDLDADPGDWIVTPAELDRALSDPVSRLWTAIRVHPMYGTYRSLLAPVRRSMSPAGYQTMVDVAGSRALFRSQPDLIDAARDRTPLGSPATWETIFREHIISGVVERLLPGGAPIDRTPEEVLWYEILPIGMGYWSYFVDEYTVPALTWEQFRLIGTSLDEYEFYGLDQDGDGAVSLLDLAISYPAEFLAYCAFCDSSFACADPDSPEIAISVAMIDAAIRNGNATFPPDYHFPDDVAARFDADSDGIISLDDLLREVLLPSARLLTPMLTGWLRDVTNVTIGTTELEAVLDSRLSSLDAEIDPERDGISRVDLTGYSASALRAWHLVLNCPVDVDGSPLPLTLARAQSVLPDLTEEEFGRMDRDGDGVFSTAFNDFVDSDASIFFFGDAMRMFARFYWVLYGSPPQVVDGGGHTVPWTWRGTVGTAWWERIYGEFGVHGGGRTEVIDDREYEAMSNAMWGMIGKGQLIEGSRGFYTDYCYVRMLLYYLPYLSCLLPRRNSNLIFDRRLAWERGKIESFDALFGAAGELLREIAAACKERLVPPSRGV
jgi:Ca2+-binding EF-hand superfamily protein